MAAVMDGDETTTLNEIRQQVRIIAEAAEDGRLLADAFTEWAVDFLHGVGEIEGGEPYTFVAPRVGRISGHYFDAESQQVDVFVTDYDGSGDAERLTASAAETLLRGAVRLLEKCRAGWHRRIEESSPGFEFGEIVAGLPTKQSLRVRILLLTDKTCGKVPDAELSTDGLDVTYGVWDLARFNRIRTSGKQREEITIDFTEAEFGGEALSFIRMPEENAVYETYLAIVPGQLLATIYRKYGARLLEQNVRSFLQVRGKVNKGIRSTILNEPEMFLAYNNGICATAAQMDMATGQGPSVSVSKVTDFQIVNGGQTTASLASAVVKDRADLAKVAVQVKLSVIKDDAQVGSIVANIARFANTQNKVNEADLRANDAFHVRLEELSRTVWAPTREGEMRETKWFYERARGQYADERARCRTDAQRRRFEAEYPSKQWFTKTDLGKFENTWDLLPHLVCRGAQKNFIEFMLRLSPRGEVAPDQRYFENLVAKAICFKTAERLVSAHEFGGYRAQIVTYTLSWIFFRAGRTVDLAAVWRRQSVDEELTGLIDAVCPGIHRHITDSRGQNVTEWCKREQCWKSACESDLELSSRWLTLLESYRNSTVIQRPSDSITPEEETLVADIARHGAEFWFALSHWAKETGSLEGWQRSIAFSIGRLISKQGKPSLKQAVQGKKIVAEAERLGFAMKTT